jgi:hypothetical protein
MEDIIVGTIMDLMIIATQMHSTSIMITITPMENAKRRLPQWSLRILTTMDMSIVMSIKMKNLIHVKIMISIIMMGIAIKIIAMALKNAAIIMRIRSTSTTKSTAIIITPIIITSINLMFQ